MKLTALIFLDGLPKLPGFRALGQGPYADWTVHVRPHAVFLVSPPGWQVNTGVRAGDKQTVHEIPRNRVLVTWERDAAEDLGATGIWSPPSPPQDLLDVDPASRGAEGPATPTPPAEAGTTRKRS